MNLETHLWKFIILIILGIGYAIFIFLRNKVNTARAKKLAALLKNTELNKNEFAETLDMLVSAKPVTVKIDFRQKFKSLAKDTLIGKYKILLQTPIDSHSLLIIATCDDEDFGLAIGHFGAVKKVYYYSFLIKQNITTGKLEIYSGMYNDLNEKNLQKEFASKVFELV